MFLKSSYLNEPQKTIVIAGCNDGTNWVLTVTEASNTHRQSWIRGWPLLWTSSSMMKIPKEHKDMHLKNNLSQRRGGVDTCISSVCSRVHTLFSLQIQGLFKEFQGHWFKFFKHPLSFNWWRYTLCTQCLGFSKFSPFQFAHQEL